MMFLLGFVIGSLFTLFLLAMLTSIDDDDDEGM